MPVSSPRSSAPGLSSRPIGLLGLDPNAALPSLLACAAPIGTTGTPSFYQSLFATPAVSSVDPGAQTATLTGTLFAGDILRTTIDGANIDHVVAAGETPAAAAAAIAAAINASPTSDPVSSLPIGQRFYAVVQGSSFVIDAGFAVTVPPRRQARPRRWRWPPPIPPSHTLTLGGTVTAGDVVQFAIDSVPISYTVAAGDTLASIADALRDVVNATTAADPYSGQALNTIVAASSAAGVVTLIAAGPARLRSRIARCNRPSTAPTLPPSTRLPRSAACWPQAVSSPAR